MDAMPLKAATNNLHLWLSGQIRIFSNTSRPTVSRYAVFMGMLLKTDVISDAQAVKEPAVSSAALAHTRKTIGDSLSWHGFLHDSMSMPLEAVSGWIIQTMILRHRIMTENGKIGIPRKSGFPVNRGWVLAKSLPTLTSYIPRIRFYYRRRCEYGKRSN